MAWIAGVVSAAAGLYQGSQASGSQTDALNNQLGIQRADLAFRQEVYQDQKDFAKPIADELQGQALQGGPLDYGPMKDQITLQYGNAERGLEAQMAQRGLTGTGLDAGATRGLMLRQAGDLSNAYRQGLINKRQLALTLLGHDQRMQAGSLVGQGNQNLAGTFGTFAGMYGQAAQAGYSAAASGLGYGLYQAGLQQTPSSETPPPPTGGPAAPTSISQTPGYGSSPPPMQSEWGAGSDMKTDW